MKWKQYPKYISSGISWPDTVPETWNKIRLGYEAIMIVPMRDKPQDFDGDIPWIRIEDFEGKYISDSKSGQKVSISTIQSMNLKVFPIGTVLCSCSCRMGATAIVKSPLISNQTFIGIVPGQNLSSDYIYYVMQAFAEQLQVQATGAIQQYLSREDFQQMRFVVPSLEEQKSIASFLDRETARIDQLIAKKERQIELLQEKRSALISRAVTKGLNPKATMKGSGIEWLGEIPEHWNVKPIKRIGAIKYGLGTPPEQRDDGVAIIRATDIHQGKIYAESVQRVDPDDVPWSRDPELRANDILVVRSGAYTGDSAIVPAEWDGAIAGYDMVLRVKHAMPQFVSYALLSKYLLDGQIYLEKMRAAQPHLNAEELGSFYIVLPPLEEQKGIVCHIEKQTAQIDEMIVKIQSSSNLLREYRTALISAAVTGKIDVREEVA